MDWEDLLAQALGNKIRIRIIRYLLERKGANVSRISRELGIPYTSAKRNLKALSDVGVLEEISVGRARLYKLSDSEVVRRLILCVIGYSSH